MSLISFSPLHGAPKAIKKSVPRDSDGAYRLIHRLDGVDLFTTLEDGKVRPFIKYVDKHKLYG